jgi:hypothetical protein
LLAQRGRGGRNLLSKDKKRQADFAGRGRFPLKRARARLLRLVLAVEPDPSKRT